MVLHQISLEIESFSKVPGTQRILFNGNGVNAGILKVQLGCQLVSIANNDIKEMNS